MNKQIAMFQVREFSGSNYSRQLGRRLRVKSDAQRIAKVLRKQGRTIVLAKLMVAA